MTDSLVLGGVIELLGGGVASTHPQAAGAYFRLGTGYDMGAPQITSEQVAGLLLDGEVVSGFRASNRTPTLPVVIQVLSTGSPAADRQTLAGARELLLQTASQDNWELTWTRDGGDPLIFDCMGLASTVVHYSIRTEESLVSLVDISFQAFPYARSDTQEVITFANAAAIWPQPPTAVLIDDFGATVAGVSFLTGDGSTFEGGTAAWTQAGNCTIARSTAQAHTGTASLALTSVAAGNMQAAHVAATAGVLETAALACQPGDTITVSAFSRAATVARSVNVGCDFYDATDTFISTLRGSNVTNLTTSFTANPTATLTAPPGTAWARVSAQAVSTAGAGEVHYFDDVTINRGAVQSADSPSLWTRSAAAATGSYSARWSWVSNDDPVYDHTLPAAVNITGLTKLTFWFGLASTPNQWAVWHRGNVSFKITLYDGSGNTLQFGVKRLCQASALSNSPHWQFISAHIPQVTTGFDYTTISRYVIEAWSRWDSRISQGGLFPGQKIGAVLQASAYFCAVTANPTAVGAPTARGALYVLPGIIGTARSPLAIQAAPSPSAISTVTEFTTAGTQNWTSPAGTSVIDKVECWGAGGGGAGANNQTLGGGGGGGGEYAMALAVAITPSTLYHPVVGAPGAAGGIFANGQAGGDSYFAGNSLTVYAHGGSGGYTTPGQWGGGKGGQGSVNYVHYSGGQGYQANADSAAGGHGGGGGSSGGRASAGVHPTDFHGASKVDDGGPGAEGGRFDTHHTGNAPSSGPGGAGGGGANLQGPGNYYAGGAGYQGKVRLTYGAAGLVPLASLLLHCPSREEPDAFNPLCPVGNGADVPDGTHEYAVPAIGNLAARFDGTYTAYLVASSWSGGFGSGSSRTVTVQFRQYPYSGGTAVTQNISRTLTPGTDLAGTGQFVDLGPVTLPLADIPPGSLSPYFAVTVTSSLTADRFLDLLLISTAGDLVLLNVGSGSVFQNIWIDQPDSTRDLGRILGSNADRDQAVSALSYAERYSGGPLAVYPDGYNRILAYSAQGAPAVTGFYPPQWWTERLQT